MPHRNESVDPRKNGAQTMTLEFIALRDGIERRHARGEGWTKIAQSFNHERITRGHIYKMVTGGWEPNDPELRIILGLPAYKPVPVCPIHGVVHDYDCQTQTVKPVGKPRKPRRPRIAVDKENMASAARSIVNNMSPGKVNQLVVKLLTILDKEK